LKKNLYLLIISLFSFACTKEIIQQKLTTSATPVNGGTVSPASGSFENGSLQSILATPSGEYIFKEWQGNLSGNVNPSPLKMDADKEVIGAFVKRQYPLNLTYEGSGTVKEEIISIASNSQYPSGTTVKLSPSPAEGWQFVSWKGDVNSKDNHLTLLINSSKSITAVFEKKNYNINISIEGNGTVKEEVIGNNSTIPFGSTLKLTALPNPGWQFKEWKGDLSGNTNPLSIQIDKSKNITAVFETKPFIPNIGNFYHGGIISRIYKIQPNNFNYSNDPLRPNYIIEKLALEDNEFGNLQEYIDKFKTSKIDKTPTYPFFNDRSILFWTTISDSLIKYRGAPLNKLINYHSALRLTDKQYYLGTFNFASYFTENVAFLKTLLENYKGELRLASMEYIINNTNIIEPELGDFYGKQIHFISDNQAPPKIFEIDKQKRVFKVFQNSPSFGSINYNDLIQYVGILPYNISYGFRLPTLKEIEIINKDFYLKGLIRFGNNITFSNEKVPDDSKKIQIFNFGTQKIENVGIDNYRVASPLIVKEIAY